MASSDFNTGQVPIGIVATLIVHQNRSRILLKLVNMSGSDIFIGNEKVTTGVLLFGSQPATAMDLVTKAAIYGITVDTNEPIVSFIDM